MISLRKTRKSKQRSKSRSKSRGCKSRGNKSRGNKSRGSKSRTKSKSKLNYKKAGSNNTINYPTELPTSKGIIKDIWYRTELQPNKILQDMYKTQSVKDKNNNSIKYNSGISPKEGWYLYELIMRNNIKNILEVGMAYGTSALYICQALKDKSVDGNLISIDPFQSTQWKSIGLLNLERAKLDKYHSLIEIGSEIGLPSLLSEGKQYELIFIDGMHLFDYTLLDIFYAAKLLKLNGLIVVDDIKHKAVKHVMLYIKNNYPFLKLIESTASSDTMATFIKISEDTRSWDFHKDF